MATMGRPSLFGQKNPKYRMQGVMTTDGGRLFEAARADLADLTGLAKKKISDADVFEYLSRGREATVAFLKAEGKLKGM